MAGAFAQIAFTPHVKAQQTRLGSREAYARREAGEGEVAALGPDEIGFIEERDSFYQGTVGETGWPYVQHRGGPVGLLKVLDERTLGYADFSGNRQYVSAGNLAGNDRVCLFLMDYPRQRRLKILGRARVVEEANEPELIARLEDPHYRARVERGIVIRIEAFDWNCPQYITPRFTEDEVARRVAEAVRDGAHTQSPARDLVDAADAVAPIGSGELSLVVSGVQQMTPRIRAYELRSADWGELPAVTAGAHLELPVRLANGTLATRQYSLATHPERRDRYEIAVLREEDGRGGSAAIHANWQIGTRLNVPLPLNHFPLHGDHRPAVLIAGGIGITPIKAMAQALKARSTAFELHYTGRTPLEMAYRDRLVIEFPAGYRTYCSRLPGHSRLDIASVLCAAPADSVCYVCGPSGLIKTVLATATDLNLGPERVQYESFA